MVKTRIDLINSLVLFESLVESYSNSSKNVWLFSSGHCSAAPDDLQCTLCQTAGIKQASCSSPEAFRCREKSFHFLSVSVWVRGAEGPAVDRLSWLSNLTFKSISRPFLWDDCFAVSYDSHRLFLLLLKLLWFHLCTEIYIYFGFLTCGSLFIPYALHVWKNEVTVDSSCIKQTNTRRTAQKSCLT